MGDPYPISVFAGPKRHGIVTGVDYTSVEQDATLQRPLGLRVSATELYLLLSFLFRSRHMEPVVELHGLSGFQF